MTDVYTYLACGKEYATLQAAMEPFLDRVVAWTPKPYDECKYHGDSFVGFDLHGRKVVEIKFLMNHKFCNPWDGHVCGYETQG